jgi:homocysteine S-methyltransferase
MINKSPIDPFIEQQGVLILDGGLATELENRGHNLDHPLWSARILIEDPGEIVSVHHTYLAAGADCIISSSYQATVAGFVSEGLSETNARDYIKRTVALACEARDKFLAEMTYKNRIRPIIAASIGPYGAYLANGAEYKGDYHLTTKQLIDFHLPRFELLSQTEADLFACETIPSIREAEALKSVIDGNTDILAWMSFSCKDGAHISDDTPIRECVTMLEDCDRIFAIGVNCTAPSHIPSLLNEIVQCKSKKTIIVYPNSGEQYDPHRKKWRSSQSPVDFSGLALEWYDAGARLIGGCCRTGPDHIAAIRKTLIRTD